MGRTRKRHGTSSAGATSERNGRAEPAAFAPADPLEKLRGYLISSAAGSKRRRKALRSSGGAGGGLADGACVGHAGGSNEADRAGAGTGQEEAEGAGRAEAEGAEPQAEDEHTDGAIEDGGDAGEETGGSAEWRCAAYSRHFGAEWSAASLDALEASRETLAGKQPGVGEAEALFAPTAGAPFPPPGMARQSDEAWMRSCGVLAPIRRAWLEKHASASPPDADATAATVPAAAPASLAPRPVMPAAGRSAYHAMCSYRDYYHPAAGLRDYEDGPRGGGLMRAAALHAAQHALVVTRER